MTSALPVAALTVTLALLSSGCLSILACAQVGAGAIALGAPRRPGEGGTRLADDPQRGAPFRPRVAGLSDADHEIFWRCLPRLCAYGDRGDRWECRGKSAQALGAAPSRARWLAERCGDVPPELATSP